jgi:cobalt-zinc-cadmium efflux system membrane fusion protein
MTACDQPNALTARRFRPHRLMTALGVGAVVLSLTAAFWIRGGLTPPGSAQSAPSADPNAPPSAGAAPSSDAIPPEVKLASPQVAQSLGIQWVPVASQPVSATIACNGRVAFNQNHYIELRARTDGIVRRIASDVGAAVDAHQTLAVIESPRLADLKAAYINAVSQSQQLQYNASRIERMAADQAVPAKNLREAQTALAQQQTTTANARQQLINLGFSEEEIASLVIDKDTTTELPLVTPWPGTIVGRHAVEGALVDRNDPLFDLADLDTMWVYLNLYEADLGHLRTGQTIAFVPDGLVGHEFTGHIDWISPEVDPRTRITQVRAEVVNTDRLLRANMYGRAKIIVEPPHEGLVVPAAAVQDYRHQSVVFVRQSPETFAVRPITIGVKLDGSWEVLSGVSAGEMVVTTGSFLLRSELEKDKLGPAE